MIDLEKNLQRVPLKIFVTEKGETRGELIRFLAPRTVERLLVELPVEGRIALFKEGLYFEKPLNIGTEKAVREVEAGSLAYWPMANSICIFYEKAKPYSPVNIIGRITENLDLFKMLNSGTKIRFERV